METVRQNLMELMELPGFDIYQVGAKGEARQTKIARRHHHQLLKAQSKHMFLQTTWDPLLGDSVRAWSPRAFPHMFRSAQTGVLMKVRYTGCLVYCETDENGCCFQNHYSKSWSCDSAGSQNRRGGDAWYKEGGVIDQGEEALQRRSR